MSEWRVQVTYTADVASMPEAALRQVDEQLADLHPLITSDESAGRITVSCDFDAESMSDAAEAVTRRAADVLSRTGTTATVRELTCMTAAEYERQALTPEVARFLDLAGTAEAAEILGVANQQVARLAKTHASFPEPVEVLAMGPVYSRSEIEAWERGWDRKRTGRPRENKS